MQVLNISIMKFNVYPDTCAMSGVPIMQAFIESLHDQEVRVMKGSDTDTCDVAVIWSFLFQFNKDRRKIYEHYRAHNIPVLILESGALKRGQLWKVGINGINSNAIWPDQNPSSDRWKSFDIDLHQWRSVGDHILLCGQNERSGAWNGLDMGQYIRETISEIQVYTDRPIIVRPHPRFVIPPDDYEQQIPVKLATDVFDFPQALHNAWAVVSFNSNPGVESIIGGVPVCCDQSSLASPVGNILADVDLPYLYDRTSWAEKLAYTEWSIEEIRDGLPIRRLLQKLC